MNILALDIGERRTGVAYADSSIAVPIALDTIHHQSPQELEEALLRLVADRDVHHLVFGLPKLLSGDEGEQAITVRKYIESFSLPEGVSHSFVDERYTSHQEPEIDKDAAAACALMGVYLDNIENC